MKEPWYKRLEMYVLVMATIATFLLVIIGWPVCSKASEWDDEWDREDEDSLHLTYSEHVTFCGILLSRLAPAGKNVSYIRKMRKKYEARMSTCLAIAGEALFYEVEDTFVLAIAWEESKFLERAKSHAGAVGPLQVLPKYWCPNGRRKGCDLIQAGIKAIEKLARKYSLQEAACHYNGGIKCGKRSRAYARRVMATKERLDMHRSWGRGE